MIKHSPGPGLTAPFRRSPGRLRPPRPRRGRRRRCGGRAAAACGGRAGGGGGAGAENGRNPGKIQWFYKVLSFSDVFLRVFQGYKWKQK